MTTRTVVTTIVIVLALYAGYVFGFSVGNPDGEYPWPFSRIAPTEEIEEVPGDNEPQACTMEAKLCPDGSAVGRTGPNCEFAPCPTPKTVLPLDAEVSNDAVFDGGVGDASVACTMDAKICPDGTAVGRTGPNCQFAPCP